MVAISEDELSRRWQRLVKLRAISGDWRCQRRRRQFEITVRPAVITVMTSVCLRPAVITVMTSVLDQRS
ncbi:hypothetical protein TIFTF001_053208 [Ficus carica]|uniref:Uncharacterized protein n=1 Tax=Ficus carica TaxID=3494 RepID=A0AA88EMI1_FICCA|nr:hypothetical protein TIFTF001_053205 [Ficus carica]GMN74711.1 hypothetical protein TIFTF001_053206 [Ficus carica]GMN74714.1 hypothetical protein TIFTF001_053207 [Ficus carica]GMN74716.1 hypothetical protein TIFTF001_053208 [Ficus carica]